MSSMQEILFSVVIPVYNVETYLEETVEAVLPQVLACSQGAEILLIDDGSTDGSGCLCDRYVEQYPEYIRVLHKENEGLLLARRSGFQIAAGKYIINCDSDDTLEPDMLQRVAEVIEKTHADVVLFDISRWSPPQKEPFTQRLFTQEQPDKEAVLHCFFHNAGAASMCAKAFRRDCLDLEKDYSAYFKKSFGEDTVQSAEIYTKANSFAYLHLPLYNYRCGSGMTGKMNPTYFQDFARINADLETYKSAWGLENFDVLVAEKVFINAARAITQSRFDKSMSFKSRRAFMAAIRQHEMLQKYEAIYSQVRPVLKKSYQVLLDGLLKEQYGFIDFSLRLKNVLRR